MDVQDRWLRHTTADETCGAKLTTILFVILNEGGVAGTGRSWSSAYEPISSSIFNLLRSATQDTYPKNSRVAFRKILGSKFEILGSEGKISS